MKNLFKNLFGGKTSEPPPPVKKKILKPDTTPDYPCPFGYKTAWFAIKDETPEAVIEKLGLTVLGPSNWAFGVNHTYASKHIFVTPCIDDFVLVIGIDALLGDDYEAAVKIHAQPFAELQYYGSHRVVGFCAWAKLQNGKALRAYSYSGDTGEVTWCEGNITGEEIALGLDAFPKSTDDIINDENGLLPYPNEENVLDIAKAWGIDPRFEGVEYEKSLGFICKVK